MYEVVVVVDIQGLKDINRFEKYLKKYGLDKLEGEESAYIGKSSTSVFNTRAFILDTLKKALFKGGGAAFFGIVMQLGDNPMERYLFNIEKNNFINL